MTGPCDKGARRRGASSLSREEPTLLFGVLHWEDLEGERREALRRREGGRRKKKIRKKMRRATTKSEEEK